MEDKVKLYDKEELKEYLLKRTTKIGDCWRFTGTHRDGYGIITRDGRIFGVHRLSAYIFHGLDLNNLNLLALHKPECKFKDCWGELHIYVGSYSDNMKDAVTTKTHVESRKTHCPSGHPYDDENTLITRFGRQCKTCNRKKATIIRARLRTKHDT